MEEHDEYDERSSTNEEMASGKQEQRNKDAMKEKKREQVNNREELITGQNEQYIRDFTHGEKTKKGEERSQKQKELKKCKIWRRYNHQKRKGN